MNVTQLLGGRSGRAVAKLTVFAGALCVGILAANLFDVRIFQPWTAAEATAAASVGDLLRTGFTGSPTASTSATERGSARPADADSDAVKVLEDWTFTRRRPSKWDCS